MDSAYQLYSKILQTANRFLRNAQQFEISELQNHEPTYDEVAKILRQVSGIVHGLVDDIDPMMAHQAIEYTSIMEKMAVAIHNSDQEELNSLTKRLDEKPFI